MLLLTQCKSELLVTISILLLHGQKLESYTTNTTNCLVLGFSLEEKYERFNMQSTPTKSGLQSAHHATFRSTFSWHLISENIPEKQNKKGIKCGKAWDPCSRKVCKELFWTVLTSINSKEQRLSFMSYNSSLKSLCIIRHGITRSNYLYFEVLKGA